MQKPLLMGLVLTVSLWPVLAFAQPACPPEVQSAKDMLKAVASNQATAVKTARPLAAARGQDVQTARGQDAQTARGQDAQTARGQDAQTARGQDVQAPRGQPVSKARASTLTSARSLLKEADAACKGGDNPRAAAHAKAAMELFKYLQ